jgi:hypothetical protein
MKLSIISTTITTTTTTTAAAAAATTTTRPSERASHFHMKPRLIAVVKLTTAVNKVILCETERTRLFPTMF